MSITANKLCIIKHVCCHYMNSDIFISLIKTYQNILLILNKIVSKYIGYGRYAYRLADLIKTPCLYYCIGCWLSTQRGMKCIDYYYEGRSIYIMDVCYNCVSKYIDPAINIEFDNIYDDIIEYDFGDNYE